MKLIFRGWSREVIPHQHDVMPVKAENLANGNLRYGQIYNRKSITWSESMTAYGKVSWLALSGDFLLKLDFTEAELRNWLRKFFAIDPEAAYRLVSEVQTEAILRLTKNAKQK